MRFARRVLYFLVVCSLGGCAYLGFHGKSIKLYPDVHGDVAKDAECLECHLPDKDPEGPATPHPGFTGCLKCHND